MINVDDLYVGPPMGMLQKDGINTLFQVVRTYNKRDIDPECPMSVAIIPMVEVVVLSGDQIGKKLRWPRKIFRTRMAKICHAEFKEVM